jgi:geranylgeranyl reductase family protein
MPAGPAALPESTDVAIVGAGPAGATAALLLARAGVEVVLLERASLPREKTCGGGVVSRALAALPDGVDVPVERRMARVEARFVDAGVTVTVERPAPVVHMAMRAPLDHALAEAARAAGAALRPACPVAELDLARDHVTVVTAAGRLRARWLLAADGATGVTARGAGWTGAAPAAPALEAELMVPARVLARHADRARFDLGIPAGGYGWVFPKATHLSVGVGALARRGRRLRLRDELQRYLHRVGLADATPARVRGAPIPVRPRPGGAARGRVLLAGDAAGLADPLTGEGISLAIRSGRLAAEALIAGGLEADAGRRYLVRLEQEILRELRVARALAWVLYDRPALARRLLPRLGQLAGDALVEVVAGRRTYRQLVGRAPAWRRCLAALARG